MARWQTRRGFLAATCSSALLTGCLRLSEEDTARSTTAGTNTPIPTTVSDGQVTQTRTATSESTDHEPDSTKTKTSSETNPTKTETESELGEISVSTTWPQPHYDPANTSHHPTTTGPEETVERVWTFQRQASIPDYRLNQHEWTLFTPSVYRGNLYVSSQDDNIYSIDAKSGEVNWRFSKDTGTEDPDRKCTPLVIDGIVFAEGSGGFLYALDAESGDMKWRVRTDLNTNATRPAVVDGILYVADGRLLAFDIETGSLVWEQSTDLNANFGVGVFNKSVYVTDRPNETLYAFNKNSGEKRWSKGLNTSIPAIDNGTLFVTSHADQDSQDEPQLFAIANADGRIEWQTNADGFFDHTPALAGDTVYVGSSEGTLHAYDAIDGTELWTHSTISSALIRSSPVVVDKHVYFSDIDGTVYCLDSTGKRQWSYKISDSQVHQPIILDGTVFVGDRSGRVHALTSPD